MSRFLFHLDQRRTGPREAVLLREFHYESDLADAIIVVPVGFLYDGASVPRVFWNIVGPFGRVLRASVIHDWLYTVKRIELSPDNFLIVDQKLADDIYLEALYVDREPPWNITWFQRNGAYRAVRNFGGEAWRT